MMSGPRCGIGDPTQAEALTMVCTRVFGNQATITFAGSQGHFELNVYKPVIAFAFLESLALLTDGMDSCVEGLAPDKEDRLADAAILDARQGTFAKDWLRQRG